MKNTKRRGRIDVRIDLYRDQAGRWRWRLRVPGHILADSGQGYSRRLDCVRGAMRVTGVAEVVWYRTTRGYDYGQAALGRGGVEFFIWHNLIEARP